MGVGIIKKNKIVEDNMLNYVLYDHIDVEDRFFVSWDEFEIAINSLSKNLLDFIKENPEKIKNIYALPRGGLVIGVRLSYLLKIPLIIDESKITENTLIVDDCTDTGKTLSKYNKNLTLVLFHKIKSIHIPTFFYEETDKQINFCWESIDERN